MAKKKRRDSSYYEERLKRDHPAIYAELRSGRLKSVRDAAIKAGLRRAPTGVQELERAWKRASATERRTFIERLKGSLPKKTASPPIAYPDGKLTADGKVRIRAALKARRITMGQVMKELGESGYNQSVASALRRPSRISAGIIHKLTLWVVEQEKR